MGIFAWRNLLTRPLRTTLALVGLSIPMLGMAALLTNLLGWHWEFLPTFFAKLVPGVDLVPFWTISVVNVWRKAKRDAVAIDQHMGELPPAHLPQK